jgi:hypothetical protein
MLSKLCYFLKLPTWYVTADGNSMLPLMVTSYNMAKLSYSILRLSYNLQQQCLTTYSNNVLQLTATMSYNLQQQCLTTYSNNVLQLTATMSYSLQQRCLTVYGNDM